MFQKYSGHKCQQSKYWNKHNLSPEPDDFPRFHKNPDFVLFQFTGINYLNLPQLIIIKKKKYYVCFINSSRSSLSGQQKIIDWLPFFVGKERINSK